MIVSEFLALGHTDWLECHWSIARTQDVAEKWFKSKGYAGEPYRICFDTNKKDSDGFFAWWMPITKGGSSNETKAKATQEKAPEEMPNNGQGDVPDRSTS